MSPKPSPNDLTRQQLDELDGLLQRMLGLPTTGPDAPALPHGFRAAFADLPAPVPAPAAPKVEAAPPVPTSSRVPVVLWPVFALNWVLETLLGLFGPLGTATRHPATKHLLGGCGVLLLAAAGVWSARGMGWVALPFPR